MRRYELMYIIRPNLSEEETATIIERVGTFVTNLGGQVHEVNQTSPWGRRRLAYPIENNQDGYYVLSYVSVDPKVARDLERNIKYTDDVLRHMLIKPYE